MRRILYWLFLPPLGALLVLFAVVNREAVTVSLDPLPFAYSLPLFAVVLLATFVGLLVGYVVATISGFARRRELRQLRRQLAMTESELHALRADAAPLAALRPPQGSVPTTTIEPH